MDLLEAEGYTQAENDRGRKSAMLGALKARSAFFRSRSTPDCHSPAPHSRAVALHTSPIPRCAL